MPAKKATVVYLYPDSRNRSNGYWNTRCSILMHVADVIRCNLDVETRPAIEASIAKANVVLYEEPVTPLFKELRELHSDNDALVFVEVKSKGHHEHNCHEIAAQIRRFNERPASAPEGSKAPEVAARPPLIVADDPAPVKVEDAGKVTSFTDSDGWHGDKAPGALDAAIPATPEAIPPSLPSDPAFEKK